MSSAPAIIKMFSDSETKPSGTLLSPPTQAHFSSRLSTYTALKTEMAPTVPINSENGATAMAGSCATIPIPA